MEIPIVNRRVDITRVDEIGVIPSVVQPTEPLLFHRPASHFGKALTSPDTPGIGRADWDSPIGIG